MNWLSSLFLGGLIGLVRCKFECYRKVESECETEWFKAHGYDVSFCEMHPSTAKCTRKAAFECKTGFEAEADKAWSTVRDLCTKGTLLNDAIKHDDHCGLKIMLNSTECLLGMLEDLNEPGRDQFDFVSTNKIHCKWTDRVKECLYKKFDQQCNSSAQWAYHALYGTGVALQKKLCALLLE